MLKVQMSPCISFPTEVGIRYFMDTLEVAPPASEPRFQLVVAELTVPL